MIPYVEIPVLPLFGGLSVRPFGVAVLLAVLVGQWYVRAKVAPRYGMTDREAIAVLLWAVGLGFLGSHLVELLAYQPARVLREGLAAFLDHRAGMSSVGGLLGGMAGLAVFARRHGRPWLECVDVVLQGFVVGWIFGRLGCALAHDHPGVRTDFFLAVRYPDGPRHDLGLYELLYTAAVLLPATLWLQRRDVRPGSFAAMLALLYAPARFLGEFLRESAGPGADARYLGLTPAQHACIAFLLGGVWLALRPSPRREPGRDPGRAA